MVVATDRYTGVIRITRSGFVDLAREHFPAHVLDEPAIGGDPGRYWDEIVSLGVDPLFVFAIFEHESTFGRRGVAAVTKSWGNTRRPSFGVPDVGLVEGASGMFSQYATWLDGCISTAARIASRNWYYAGEERSIGEVFNDPIANDPMRRPAIAPVPRRRREDGSIIRMEWAPSYDSNDPESYLGAVLARMNASSDTDESGGVDPRNLRVILVAGHWNTAGGHDTERRHVERITLELLDQMRAAGIGVELVQSVVDGRLVDYPGDHRAVARAAAERKSSGAFDWDLYFEVHLESTAAGVRGCFSIAPYNEERGDIDRDVLDNLGPRVANLVSQSTGLPLRSLGSPGGLGSMAETQTQVKILGSFVETAKHKDTTERMLFEYGAYSNPEDTAIIESPEFARRAARGTIEALAGYYGIALTPPVDPPAEDPDGRFFSETGQYLGGGFYRYWSARGGIETFGYPITPERVETTAEGFTGTVQYFERARFEHHPGSNPELWDVMLGRIGFELLISTSEAADLRLALGEWKERVRERDERIRRLESELAAIKEAVNG